MRDVMRISTASLLWEEEANFLLLKQADGICQGPTAVFIYPESLYLHTYKHHSLCLLDNGSFLTPMVTTITSERLSPLLLEGCILSKGDATIQCQGYLWDKNFVTLRNRMVHLWVGLDVQGLDVPHCLFSLYISTFPDPCIVYFSTSVLYF